MRREGQGIIPPTFAEVEPRKGNISESRDSLSSEGWAQISVSVKPLLSNPVQSL